MGDLSERLGALADRYALSPSSVARFQQLVALLAEDPHAPTALTDPERALDAHLADSLSALEFVRGRNRIVDIGSGAGFPGLPLALAIPGVRLDLLESA